MRDERGRYHSAKPITESVPDWAKGCDQCSCGIVSAPELTGVSNLYMERMVQALDHTLVFCTCQAGVRYRAALLNRRQQLIEEARRNPLMRDHATRQSHPDIEATRQAMYESATHAAPPVRWVGSTPEEQPVMEPA